MLIEKEIKIEDLSYYEHIKENALCFDIETTGLSRKYTHTTVIGTGYVKNGRIMFRQWLLENPAKEKEMLEEFSAYLKNFSTILQFNGNSFDIPYIRERCALYALPDPFAGMDFDDFYVYAKKYKHLLHLENLKQKSLEHLFDIKRKDRISGGDCITAYSRYLATGDKHARDALLLHNEEDVTGLLKINGLSVLSRITDTLRIHNAYVPESSDTSFIIEFIFEDNLPFPIDCRAETHTLQLKNRRGILHLNGKRCWRRYFFPNPKDYFYLPAEDHAIHKSVGIYVDPACRVKATRETWYEKQEDIYFYQPCEILSPAMKETYKDKDSWISLKSLKKAGKEELAQLCGAYLK